MTVDEYLSYEGKLKDIKQLKSIAKIILENRIELNKTTKIIEPSIIMRIDEDNYQSENI